QLVQLGHLARRHVAYSIHQTGGTNRQHRETQFFEADEKPKIEAEAIKHLRSKGEIVYRVLHADEVRCLFGDALERFEFERYRCATGYMVNQQRQSSTRPKIDEVFGKAPLRRGDGVGGSHPPRNDT